MKEPPPGTAGGGWTGRTHQEFRVRRTDDRTEEGKGRVGTLPIPRMYGDRQGAGSARRMRMGCMRRAASSRMVEPLTSSAVSGG